MSATRETLERELHDSIRAVRIALDDLSATAEQLRQLRQREGKGAADCRLVIEVGPNGRPEVCR